MSKTFVVLLLLIAACGGAPEGTSTGELTENTPFAIIANSPQTISVGKNRIMIALIAQDTKSLATPDRPATIHVVFGGDIVQELDAEFLWAVPDVRGLYRADITFDQAGSWGVTVSTPDLEISLPAAFMVLEERSVPNVGDIAPASATRTATENLSDISTDPDPDPRFYLTSLDQAFASDMPTVVVFSTPAFCSTSTCGPTLDLVKDLADAYPNGVNFVHAEVYENLNAASIEGLVLSPAIDEWKLPSEPWVFVVDGDGVIASAYEGTIDGTEVRADLDSLLGNNG
jgi:hypothetical protein